MGQVDVFSWHWITGCRRSMARSKSGVDLTLFLLRSRTGSLPVRLLRGIGGTPRRRSDPEPTSILRRKLASGRAR